MDTCLLPEIRTVAIRRFLSSRDRIRFRRVCRLFHQEDVAFIAPAFLIPVTERRESCIVRPILHLMEPEMKYVMEWLQKPPQYMARVHLSKLRGNQYYALQNGLLSFRGQHWFASGTMQQLFVEFMQKGQQEVDAPTTKTMANYLH